MGVHNAPQQLFRAEPFPDPGAGETIVVDRSPCVVPIISAAAEARAVADPTRAGAILALCFKTDGGDVTVTFASAFNEGGDTILVFANAGEFALFMAFEVAAGTYQWRKIADHLAGNASPAGFGTMAAPQTATDTATLTAAQMLGGVIEATPTAAAAYTTLTGALLTDAVQALHPNLAVGDTFDLTIINLGGAGDDITYTAGATGISIVGDAVVRSVADSGTEQAGQGTFRHRYASTDTWVAYRVS